jgi:hypothetical protein
MSNTNSQELDEALALLFDFADKGFRHDKGIYKTEAVSLIGICLRVNEMKEKYGDNRSKSMGHLKQTNIKTGGKCGEGSPG